MTIEQPCFCKFVAMRLPIIPKPMNPIFILASFFRLPSPTQVVALKFRRGLLTSQWSSETFSDATEGALVTLSSGGETFRFSGETVQMVRAGCVIQRPAVATAMDNKRVVKLSLGRLPWRSVTFRSAFNKREQVGVDCVCLSRGHAVRETLVGLQRPVL